MQLEDDASDILAKALVAGGLTPGDLPVDPLLRESFIQRELGINPLRLSRLASYHPEVVLPGHVLRHGWPFYGGEVNIWSIDTPDGRILIDAGLEPGHRDAALQGHVLRAILVTHAHRDHVGGLQGGGVTAGQVFAPTGVAGSNPVLPGQRVKIGACVFHALDLSGHATPALGWSVEVDGSSVFFPGDALFAGSMGKVAGPAEFRLALANVKAALASLPGDAIICPGHGPATTVAQELRNNPFL